MSLHKTINSPAASGGEEEWSQLFLRGFHEQTTEYTRVASESREGKLLPRVEL